MMAAVKVDDDIKGGNERAHKLPRGTGICRRHRGTVSTSIGPFHFSMFLDVSVLRPIPHRSNKCQCWENLFRGNAMSLRFSRVCVWPSACACIIVLIAL